MSALRQKQFQVSHLIAEEKEQDGGTLAHKLDDALVGRQDMTVILTAADSSILYAHAAIPTDHRTINVRFEATSGATLIQVAMSLDISEDALVLERLARTLIAAAVVGALVIALGGYALVQIGLRPVRDLSAQIQALEADTLHQHLDDSAQPDELAPLVAHVNELLKRLQKAYEQLEAFNADVAHELFTPLATLIGGSEIALRKARDVNSLRDVLGAQLEDLQRMSMIVQDMLFLSQADRGAIARREYVNSMAELASSVADLHEAAMEEAGLQLHVIGDATCMADIRLLQRGLSNLISNATRHARSHSTVVVEINRMGDEVSLRVVNQGHSIPAEHLPYLFNRFYRVDVARPDAARNHGLGLAIVAAIARMHGGRTTIESSAGVTSIGFVVLDPSHAIATH
ncbi:MAG: HAMP domain-containing protein [Curvibacter sp.]|nr:MAG: HAMP domain-containing protein [Curvibacter sp.]